MKAGKYITVIIVLTLYFNVFIYCRDIYRSNQCIVRDVKMENLIIWCIYFIYCRNIYRSNQCIVRDVKMDNLIICSSLCKGNFLFSTRLIRHEYKEKSSGEN